MVDYNRQLLDELMGRNRNMDPNSAKRYIKTWEDPEFCRFFMVMIFFSLFLNGFFDDYYIFVLFQHSFCPHDLFVNTRADLGPCGRIHCEETKRNYAEAPDSKKYDIENDFYRFCSSMINEVDRKIIKGKQRLDLMNSKLEFRPVSKQQEQINSINEKVQKLVREAEEAGIRGDVDQAQNLMTLCDKLKEDKEALIRQYEQYGYNLASEHQDKQMEVCEICSAFLIIGDAQSRIDDHLMGKQHIGYVEISY